MTVHKNSNLKSYNIKRSNPSYNRKKNLDKDNLNIKICNAMIKQKCKSALILDSKIMRTTSYLEFIGINKMNITSIEKNRIIHNHHLKNGISSFHGDVWNDIFSEPNYFKSYDALILDTVNAYTTISKNIKNIFKHNFLSNKSVLQMTFTKRSSKRDSNCYKDFEKLKLEIDIYSKMFGYNCIIDSHQEQAKVISVIYIVNVI